MERQPMGGCQFTAGPRTRICRLHFGRSEHPDYSTRASDGRYLTSELSLNGKEVSTFLDQHRLVPSIWSLDP
jgi:hypothetical protein